LDRSGPSIRREKLGWLATLPVIIGPFDQIIGCEPLLLERSSDGLIRLTAPAPDYVGFTFSVLERSDPDIVDCWTVKDQRFVTFHLAGKDLTYMIWWEDLKLKILGGRLIC
jgi:hypothetical protein